MLSSWYGLPVTTDWQVLSSWYGLLVTTDWQVFPSGPYSAPGAVLVFPRDAYMYV